MLLWPISKRLQQHSGVSRVRWADLLQCVSCGHLGCAQTSPGLFMPNCSHIHLFEETLTGFTLFSKVVQLHRII